MTARRLDPLTRRLIARGALDAFFLRLQTEFSDQMGCGISPAAELADVWCSQRLEDVVDTGGDVEAAMMEIAEAYLDFEDRALARGPGEAL